MYDIPGNDNRTLYQGPSIKLEGGGGGTMVFFLRQVVATSFFKMLLGTIQYLSECWAGAIAYWAHSFFYCLHGHTDFLNCIFSWALTFLNIVLREKKNVRINVLT